MSETVDARGLSCPQPVLDFMSTAQRVKNGEIVVLLDSQTARENVVRAAGQNGWEMVQSQAEGLSEFKLVFKK